MRVILRVEDLCKTFTLHMLGGKTITACQDVSFHVEEGSFLGIFGPSGSGKSTILKCIYRTYLPSKGRLRYVSRRYGEVDLARATERQVLLLRQEIGYVSQFLKIMPRVTAVDVVAEGLWLQGTEQEKARKIAREYLERLGVARELWDAYPATFSGGEQQRVNLARALITRPRLLLLDEPTASLDVATKKTVLALLQELKEAGTTMIGIFHDLEAARRVVDSTFVMQDGYCYPENGGKWRER
ncbi:MAG: alpha-D-ribose 1-methylphosphonate 5-triphosphate synthase subunit PhnL [Moorella sp. (in: firmicutes)]|jgi:alpha-D-ribose 1-methylphosphonate 5-triphosphate synthase subunit PhnL|nr:alpha-D-ribose 1-methylphosphonate 5-triphosphate synthase subunit PhnL [Moorella sp. (in: firmicutes)]MDK2895198.1 alpha-D-ribose 1-methylphosphonate 5-triphosphate synthase subunit PhnL [Moorella sp. (in: firmicutes)]